MQRVKSIDGITIFFPSLPKNPRHRALVFTISSRYIFSRRETNRDATLSYLERISEIHTEELLLLSLSLFSFSLSNHTLLITGSNFARKLSANRIERCDLLERRIGKERKGKRRLFVHRSMDRSHLDGTHTLSLSLSLSLWGGREKKAKKKRSWWLDCRHGSVFEAAHRAHFINGAGRVVDAFACRLNVAGDWPRYYKRGAPLATGCSGTVAPSEGESVLRVRGERCFRASLSL